MAKPAARRLRDFGSYGNLEALNALLLPALAIYYGWPTDRGGVILLAVANVALIIGLVIGAFYWWGVAARLKRNRRPMVRALRLADLAQRPMLVATLAAIALCLWQIAAEGMTWTNIVAILLTTLAALEYVNYYHVQLQYFDNRADFTKMRRGAGFKRAHMARDLAAFRAEKP
ncbi:hypothetical protein [Sphingomonas sp.]|uniref:hypothetical protein n=1 Tax=Sphingomonas sp. TaxID=28214 RepID=UPI00286A4BCA|nr:hypothetical protein [Sphingomonas sp.]